MLIDQSSRDDTLADVGPPGATPAGAVSHQSSRDKHRKRSAKASSMEEEGRAISTEPLLEVTNLTKVYDESGGLFGRGVRQPVRAVDDVSFSLSQSKTLGLVGESGSGKSTTAHMIVQLVKQTSGSIVFLGTELTRCKGESLRRIRRDVQIIFQDPYSSLDPRFTVAEIVEEPLRAHGVGTRRDRQRAASELLDRVGVSTSLANRRPHEFSGGERQRIAIARALALRPRLIVCDEPVSALDVSIQAQILNLLRDIQEEMGIAYLFISHDLAVVRVMSDRIAVMRQGKIVELDQADSIYEAPKDPYTQALLSAVPVPDPDEMARRRSADSEVI